MDTRDEINVSNIDKVLDTHIFVRARCLASEDKCEQMMDWPYVYEQISSSEGGTVQPKSEEYGGSLFIFPLATEDENSFHTMDDVPSHVMTKLYNCTMFLSTIGWKYIIISHDTTNWNKDSLIPDHVLQHSYAFVLVENIKNDNRARIRGHINVKTGYDVNEDLLDLFRSNPAPTAPSGKHSFTGPIIILRCNCKKGMEALIQLKNTLDSSIYSWIVHNKKQENININSNTELCVDIETGIGPIASIPFSSVTFLHRNLSTLFILKLKDSSECIAKCLLSYYCENFDAQGPTIEMISVKKEYRGYGYCYLLYQIVEKYCMDNWTAKGVYNNELCRRIMVTSQPGSQIELRKKKNGDIVSITDRIFFSHYLGFDEHQVESFRKPIPGQDQVKYFKEYISTPYILNPNFRHNFGKQSCFCCAKISGKASDFKRCSKCKIAFYCNEGLFSFFHIIIMILITFFFRMSEKRLDRTSYVLW